MFNFSLKAVTFVALIGCLFTACTEDPIITGNPIETAPSIKFATEAGFLNKDATIDVGASFKVKVEMVPGSSDLNAFEVLEAGKRLDVKRIQIANIGTANNPQLITGTNKKGATYEITILPDATVTEEKVLTYAVEVTDEAGKSAAVSLTITTDIALTTLSKTLTGILLNQGGPEGTGGLDLDEGKGVGSTDVSAEIQDEGINTGLANDKNWRRQIAGVNGAVLRVADLKAITENLTFKNVAYKEQVVQAFETGKEVDGTDVVSAGTSDKENNEKVSLPVKVGDVFAVKKGNNYYLLECTKITETPSDNKDSYEFSIKY
jgi:hypothetical protein